VDTITELIEYLVNSDQDFTSLVSNNSVANNKLATKILSQYGLTVLYQQQLEGYSTSNRPLYIPIEYHSNFQVIGAAQYLDSILMGHQRPQGNRFMPSILSYR
jgi:hypothetical protein